MKQVYYERSGTFKTKLHTERFWECPRTDTGSGALPLQVVKIGYSNWRAGKRTARESYNSFGIELVCAGNAHYVLGKQTIVVEAGEAFLKLPGRSHSYATGPRGFLHKRFIDVVGPDLHTSLKSMELDRCQKIRVRRPAAFAQFFKMAVQLYCEHGTDYDLELSALAYRMLAQLSRDNASTTYPGAVRDVLDYMHRNLAKKIDGRQLSVVARMSVPHLYRLFTHHIGEPPLQYFRRQKMEHAKDLLLYGEQTVKEIAYSLGYENPFAFSTQFGKCTGVSPRDFRRRTPADYV